MPVIDDRGRLFGRVNVIDLVIALVLLMLIPLGYGAYLLFKTPKPMVTGVEPKQIIEGTNPVVVRLHGEHFRPFLQAAAGRLNADEFLVVSPTEAEIRLSRMPVGTYDLTLYDGGELLARVPSAFAIVRAEPPPPPPVNMFATQVVGTFTGLTKPQVDGLHVGTKLPANVPVPSAEVLALRPAGPARRKLRVESNMIDIAGVDTFSADAVLKLFCAPNPDAPVCSVGPTSVAIGVVLNLPIAGGSATFRVDDIRPVTDPPAFSPLKVAHLLGGFVDVSAARIAKLKPGVTFNDPGNAVFATIDGVADPTPAPAPGKYAVLALLTVRCRLMRDSCFVGDDAVQPKVTLTLPHPDGMVRFLIQESHDENRPLALPTVGWVRAIGTIVDLDRGTADSLTVGAAFTGVFGEARAEVLVKGPPEPFSAQLKVSDDRFVAVPIRQRVQVAAILRIRCNMAGTACNTSDGAIAPNAPVTLSWRGRATTFVPQMVGPDVDPQMAEITVRFVVRPEARPLMKVGHIDTGAWGLSLGADHSAVITALGADQDVSVQSGFDLTDEKRIFATLPDRVIAVEAKVRLPLELAADAWVYRGQSLRAGSILNFNTSAYFIRGWVRDVPPPPRH